MGNPKIDVAWAEICPESHLQGPYMIFVEGSDRDLKKRDFQIHLNEK